MVTTIPICLTLHYVSSRAVQDVWGEGEDGGAAEAAAQGTDRQRQAGQEDEAEQEEAPAQEKEECQTSVHLGLGLVDKSESDHQSSTNEYVLST